MTAALRAPLHPRDALNQSLARRARAGDLAARDAMVEANLKLARREANRFAARHRRDADLVYSDALLGLVRAADGYDPDHGAGAAFSTYATWAIRNEMLWAWQEDRAIYVPRGHFRAGGVPESYRGESEAARAGIVSLPAAGIDLAGSAPDPDELTAEREARSRLADRLAGLIGRLPERDREAIRRYHGLGGCPEETLGEIGRRWGVTKARAGQVHGRALRALRAMMAETGADS